MTERLTTTSSRLAICLSLALSCTTLPAKAGVTVPALPPSPVDAPQKPATSAPIADTGDGVTDDFTQDAHVLGELARRKAALDRREHDIEQREAQAMAAETLARKEVDELSTLRAEVEKIVNEQTDDASADLTKLADLFANMKPGQAAAILGKLDISKSAAILRRLQTRMAGPVLAAMDPAVAAGVTQELEKAHAAFQE
jgi:flagellar motility protein MotE (MotC chaperone)